MTTANQDYKTLLRPMAGYSAREKGILGICIILILWGMYGLYLQVFVGHDVTGMRDHVVWGLYIVNFIFFIGLGYSGAIIASLLRLSKQKWRHPVIRLSLMMSVIAGIVGPVFILLCIGRLDRLHFLFTHPRIQSPIVWDVFAVITFLAGAILFLYLVSIRDFGFLQGKSKEVGKRKSAWYKRLSLGFSGTDSQNQTLGKTTDGIAAIIIPVSIIVSSILSWIFGMTLRPGWNSTIFGPYFVLASLYSGVAMVIFLMYVFRRSYNLQKFIGDELFRYMGYALIILGAGYGYFTFSEYFTEWYTSEKWSDEVIHKLFDFNQYGWWSLFANFGGIVLPFIVMGFRSLRTPVNITVVSSITLFAMWVKRYLIIVPTLETPLIPIQDIRPEYVTYTPTWVEWSLTFGGIGFMVLMFILISKFISVVPITAPQDEKSSENVALEY